MKGKAADKNRKMQQIIGLCVLFALCSVGLSLKETDTCTNPAGKPGQCISFRECGPILKIYNKAIISPDETKFVSESQCGWTADKKPLVCCAVSADNPRLSIKKETLPKPPLCGTDFSDRIYGGQRTALDEFSWAALIEYRKPNGKSGFDCGATLINSRYVITAAHCIEGIPRGWEVIGVRLGEWDLDSEIDCLDNDCADAPVDMGIEKIIVHEDYNPRSKPSYDDIALIRFTEEANTTLFIFPVCLPIDHNQRTANYIGTNGWVVGWGKTETGISSRFKLKVQLQFKEFQSCSELYRRSGVILRDTQICVGGVRGKDSCSGDSGGGLTKLVRANHFLYGIVSFGPGKCGINGMPGVYTNVAKYVDWIEGKLE